MALARLIRGTPETIRFAHTAAVVAGEIVTLAGTNYPVIATHAYAANQLGDYYARQGVFELMADAAQDIARGAKVYVTPSTRLLVASGATSQHIGFAATPTQGSELTQFLLEPANAAL